MSTKDEIHTKIKAKGTFGEKLPLNPQKLLLILQQCCKIIGVQGLCPAFKGVEGFFTKNLSKLQFFQLA